MYRVYDGESLVEFVNYSALLNYLSSFNHWCGTEYSNSFFNLVGVNPNDMCVFRYPFYWYGERWDSCKRSYRVWDDDWNNIYDSLLVRDTQRWVYSEQASKEQKLFMEKRNIHQKRKYSRWCIPESAYPEFRRGPWPGIANRCRYSRSYRRPRLMNEKRNTAYKEIAPYVRSSRGKNLPDVWELEPMRDWRNSGWKRQGKFKHQWEHKAVMRSNREYGKGIYVYRDSSSEWEDLEEQAS